MCGIAGYFGSEDLSQEQCERCLQLMRRRGPDNAAFRRWVAPSGRKCVLLHSRLNIIDLDDRANQPFNVGNSWIATNGELYNYVELQSELQANGREFRTSSDTEVLLTGLMASGTTFLDHCEGMWAFAVYDQNRGTLMLSRDRFGEKPLFVYRTATGLFFGSEVKFILALLGERLGVNKDHVLRYLINGYKSLYKTRETFFHGLQEVEPGSVLEVDCDGNEQTTRYWEFSYEPVDTMTREEAVDGARERLIRSVELRLRADVPLAFCLSGGIDSNSLVAIAKRQFDYDVHGFTIQNTDARYEEQEMVDVAVQQLGIRHTSVPVQTEEFLPRLRTLVAQHDAPVYTITYFAHWLLMRSIHESGYRISVSGTAADELFSGYYDHHLAYLSDVQGDQVLYESSRSSWERYIRPIVRNPLLQDPDVFSRNPRMRDHIFFKADGFARCLVEPWHETFTETEYASDLLRNRMLNELFHEAVPVILHEDDHNAMYFSIENRSPFLDRALFEFCLTIPTRHLINRGYAKSILRDAMRGLVPDAILENRRKTGFNAPILSFLDVNDPSVRTALLEPSAIFDYVKRDAIESRLQESDLPNSESKFLFYFLSAKMFLEEYAA